MGSRLDRTRHRPGMHVAHKPLRTVNVRETRKVRYLGKLVNICSGRCVFHRFVYY